MAQAPDGGWTMRSVFARPNHGGLIRIVCHLLARFVVIVTFRDHPQHALRAAWRDRATSGELNASVSARREQAADVCRARVRERAAQLGREAQLRRAAEQDEFYEGPEDRKGNGMYFT